MLLPYLSTPYSTQLILSLQQPNHPIHLHNLPPADPSLPSCFLYSKNSSTPTPEHVYLSRLSSTLGWVSLQEKRRPFSQAISLFKYVRGWTTLILKVRHRRPPSFGLSQMIPMVPIFHNCNRVLKESAPSFPPEFSSFKILPSLIQALEFGGASAASIIPLLLQLGENISPEDYPSVVLAPLIKLFSSPDRGIRLTLLDDLSKYADALDKKTVVDKIWPHLVRFPISFTRCAFLIVFASFSKLDFLILSLLFENRRSSLSPSFHPRYFCLSTLPTEC
jgi:hypothetical protein